MVFSRRYASLFTVLLLLFLILPVAPIRADAPAREPGVIIVGGNRNYPPYEFFDDEGNPAGYNVDLSRAIAN